MEVEDGRGAPELLQGGQAHPGLHQVAGFEQAGEIVEDKLGIAFGAEADDWEPGGLRLGADDGQVLADEGVEEGGLAHVGDAGEGDMAGLGHRGKLVPPRGETHSARTPEEPGRCQMGGWRRPTLPGPLEPSTIGAAGLNGRVRNGNGWGPCALVVSHLCGARRTGRKAMAIE
jgi:hypothetical protein